MKIFSKLTKITSKTVKEPKMTEQSLPPVLLQRYYKLILLGVLSLVVILGGTIIFGHGSEWYKIVPLAIVIILIIFIQIKVFLHEVDKNGYKVFIGICESEIHSHFRDGISNPTIKKRVKKYIIKTTDGRLIELPVNRYSSTIPEGMKVKIYTPASVVATKRDGIETLSTIWEYEIIADNDINGDENTTNINEDLIEEEGNVTDDLRKQ